MRCEVCFRHCDLKEGQLGFCKARICREGKIVADNYGYITSIGLDPIEKKPLYEFHPGSYILSLGSYGCNLACPFCQNYEISQYRLKKEANYYSPEDIISQALYLKERYGNIGLAFTYNEALVGYEYVLDCAKLAHEHGLLNVLVTNGCASLEVLHKILPYIDGMNIDLKGFDEKYFSYIGSSLSMTKEFIKEAYQHCHVELTTLVVTLRNDDLSVFEEECKWIASLDDKIPLHLSRYFPRYKEKSPATPMKTLLEMEKIAKKYLKSVYLGNV